MFSCFLLLIPLYSGLFETCKGALAISFAHPSHPRYSVQVQPPFRALATKQFGQTGFRTTPFRFGRIL